MDHQVGFLLRRATQGHAAIFLDGMAAPEMAPAQSAALVKVAGLWSVTQNPLERLTAMGPATIQAVVTRAADPLDKRAVVLAATPLAADERRVFLSLLRRLG